MKTTAFNLSTSTAKCGKLGLGKLPEVVNTAYEIKPEQKTEFLAAVTAKLEDAEANRTIALKRFSRTNRASHANAVVRIDQQIAAYNKAIRIAA